MPGPLLARKVRLQARVQPDTVPRPTVTGCSPSGAIAGGTVTVTGHDFWYPNSSLHQYHAFAVRFGNGETGANASNVAVANGNALTCTVPAGTAGQTVPIRVWGPGGDNVGNAAFTYSNATGFSPGTVNGGQVVTVTGVGLDGTTTWGIGGGIGGNVTSANGTTVKFTLPNGIADGNYTLNVAVPGGNVSVGGTSSFLVSNTPHPSAISPNTGYTAGGDAITITGQNLQGVTSGTLGGVALTSLVVVNSQQITAVTGAHAAGAVDLVLTNAVGSSTLPNAFTYVQWTPAVSDPTGWWEDYAGASWASKPSAGTSGSAPALVNGGASYPATGTAMSGHYPVLFGSSQWLHASSPGSLIYAFGPSTVVVLAKWPTTYPGTTTNAHGANVLVTINGGWWGVALNGTVGGSPGVVGAMVYNNNSDGNLNEVDAVVGCTSGVYKMIIFSWSTVLGSTGATVEVYDVSASGSMSQPASTHFNGFGPRVPGDVPLAGSTDPTTTFILGANMHDSGSGTPISTETLSVLTYQRLLTSSDKAYLLDYYQRHFGVP